MQGRPALIRRVVKEILLDVKRIKDLGVKKVLVAMSPPQKCFPFFTATEGCNTNDTSTSLHNSLLREGLRKLNDEYNDKSFLTFDLYSAFVSIFKNKGVPGTLFFLHELNSIFFFLSFKTFSLYITHIYMLNLGRSFKVSGPIEGMLCGDKER